MGNDETWRKDDRHNSGHAAGRNQNAQDSESEDPGDTDAADIVGRTGEEMPEVGHDTVDNDIPET